MKLTNVIASLGLLALVVVPACSSKDDKAPSARPAAAAAAPSASAPTAKAAKGRSIPNSAGLVVDAPARWEGNGVGGAAGLHLADDAGMLMVRETSADEAAKGLDAFKADTEAMLFGTWLSAEATADGFEALWIMDAVDDEMNKVGTQVGFQVRRAIGGKVHDCYGTAKVEADAREGLALCKQIAGS